MPQFSPDGRRVAFTSNRSGEWEIWLADPDGSNAVQLTSMGARPRLPPLVSRRRIGLCSTPIPKGSAEVYVIPAAGGKPRNLTSHPATDAFPSFSRDGKWIYFNSNRTGGDPDMEDAGIGRGCRPGDKQQRRFAPLESPDGAYSTTSKTWTGRAPCGACRFRGAVKVLEGVVWGTSRCSREASTISTSDGLRVTHDFSTSTSRRAGPRRSLATLATWASPHCLSRRPTILYSRMDSSVDDLMLVENFDRPPTPAVFSPALGVHERVPRGGQMQTESRAAGG